jgi:hypothetical protein
VEEASTLVKVDVETEKNKLVSNRDFERVKFEATDHKTKMVSFSSIFYYKQAKKVRDVVCEWQKDTEILIQEVENTMEQARTRHVQQDEFRKLLEKVMEQNNKYYQLLDPISIPIPIPTLEHFSS